MASDEKSVIKELTEEAEKRKKKNNYLNEAGLGRDLTWLESEGSKLDQSGLDGATAKAMSDYISSMSATSGSDSSKAALAKTLSSFLGSSSSSSSSGGIAGLASQSTLSAFIGEGGGSGSSGKKGATGSTQPGMAEQKTLDKFLESNSGNGSDSKNGSRGEVPFGDVDLTKLIAETVGTEPVSIADLEDVLNSLKFQDKGERLDIYDELIKHLKHTHHKLSGLDTFLAESVVLSRKALKKINVSSEIIRTNFTIENEVDTPEQFLIDTDIYLDNALNNLPDAVKLNEVSKYLKKIKGIYKVDRTGKEYHIPNWFNKRNRDNMEMRVKQLNRLSSKTAKKSLAGANPPSNDFIKSLNNLLKFQTTAEEEIKEGFSQAGINIDELNQLRKKFFGSAPNESVYRSIKDSKIMNFDEYGFVTYDTGIWNEPLLLPQFFIGNIAAARKRLSETGDLYPQNGVREQFLHKVYNTSVEALLRKAPDFRQNMYVGMFVYTCEDEGTIQDFELLTNSINGYTDDDSISLKRTGNNKSLLTQMTPAYDKILHTYFVRMQDMEIPGASVESFDMKFLNRSIKKAGSTFSENHKITINFTVDEFGLIVRNFNLLTGQFGYIYNEVEHNKYADTFFPVEFSTSNKGRLDLVVTYNDFRINKNYLEGEMRTSAFFPAMQNVEDENSDVENRNGQQVWGDPRAYRRFVLEDVKILGVGGDLKFQRDNSGRMTVGVDLIFKRITTVDNNKTN